MGKEVSEGGPKLVSYGGGLSQPLPGIRVTGTVDLSSSMADMTDMTDTVLVACTK